MNNSFLQSLWFVIRMHYVSEYFQIIFSETPSKIKYNISSVIGIVGLGKHVEYLARGVGLQIFIFSTTNSNVWLGFPFPVNLRTSKVSAFSKRSFAKSDNFEQNHFAWIYVGHGNWFDVEIVCNVQLNVMYKSMDFLSLVCHWCAYHVILHSKFCFLLTESVYGFHLILWMKREHCLQIIKIHL